MSTQDIHRLLIEMDVSIPERYRALLKPYEVVGGEEFRVRLYCTNKGVKVFSGALAGLNVREYGYGLGGVEWREIKPTEIKIPNIEVGNRVFLFERKYTPLGEGILWIELILKADDNLPIDYLTLGEEEGIKDKWQTPLTVVNRQLLDLTIMLSQKK